MPRKIRRYFFRLLF
jgi:hypothetical protein